MDDNQLQFSGTLDIKSTLNNIQNQIKEIEKSLSPINVSLQINQDTIKQQTNQIQNQINNISKNVAPVSFSKMFTFNTQDTKQLFSQLDKYKEELSSLSKIAPAQYTTHTDGKNQIDSAKFTYYNDALKQTVTETYKVDTASQQAIQSINRMVLTGTTYSTNAYKAAQQTEKFNQQLQSFKNTVNSFGEKNISSLLDNNTLGTSYQSLLNKSDSIGDLSQLREVQAEFAKLKTATSEYTKEQKILQNVSTASNKQQIQELETLTKSEQKRQEALQQTENKIAELTSSYNTLKSRLATNENNKSGISLSSLNQSNITGLDNALDTNNIQQAQHYLKLLNDEYSRLNIMMNKKFASNALDQMNTDAQNLSVKIAEIQSKFSNIKLGDMSGFSTQVQQTGKNVENLTKNLNTYNSAKVGQDKVEAFNTLKTSVAETKKQVDDLFKSQKALENLAGSSNRFEAWVNSNPKAMKKFSDSIKQVRQDFNQLYSETDMTKLTTGLQNVNGEFSTLRASVKAAGLEGRSFFGELGNDIKKMATWTLGGTAIFGTFNEIKEGINTVNSLNTAMTNIQMITGMNSTQVGNLTQQYSNLASQLHETTSSIMTASEDFLRAGDSADETASLLKASTVMSKIAGQTQNESAESLISIMNAYSMSAKDMMSVVDKLVAVDNTSATSTAELSEAIQKTAASAQSSGVSFSQLVSWIAEVSSVSRQSADTIGTAFNSIFSRYEKVKAGADTDDQGEAVNDVEKVLKKFNISIRDQSNNFINFNTVLTEVAQKWNTLNTVEQGQISTALAGTRQRNQFLILMQHFNETLKLQTTEADSAGNAMNRYGTYAESTQAKIDDFTNAVQKMWMNMINSSTINSVVSSGTSIIDVISNIVDKLGLIPTLLGTISAVYSTIGKSAGKQYAHLLKVA